MDVMNMVTGYQDQKHAEKRESADELKKRIEKNKALLERVVAGDGNEKELAGAGGASGSTAEASGGDWQATYSKFANFADPEEIEREIREDKAKLEKLAAPPPGCMSDHDKSAERAIYEMPIEQRESWCTRTSSADRAPFHA